MSNFGLPEGWEHDYDGQRWFYTYKPTGVVQYRWPQPGDEYAVVFADFASVPILPPEDLLASQQHIRAARPNQPRKTYAAGMSATGGPLNFYDHEEFGETGGFESDALMYMGPGKHSEGSATAAEDGQQPLPESASELPNSPMQSAAKASTTTSLESTRMASSSQMAAGSSSNTHFELPSEPTPTELPSHYTAELPLTTFPGYQSLSQSASTAEPDGINMLDSRPVGASSQSPLQYQLPLYSFDPVGLMAEMPTELTALSSFEMAPVEMADPRVLAPIEKANLEVPNIAELPHTPAHPERMRQLARERVSIKRKQPAYQDREYCMQPKENSPEPSASNNLEVSPSPTPESKTLHGGTIAAGSPDDVSRESTRRLSAPTVQTSYPGSVPEKREYSSVPASLRASYDGTPPRSTSSTPQPFPISIPEAIEPDGSTGVHRAPLALRPGILAENTALPPLEPPKSSPSPDHKPLSVLPYPDDNHGPHDVVILDVEPRQLISTIRSQRAGSSTSSLPPPQLNGRMSMPLSSQASSVLEFSGNKTPLPTPPSKHTTLFNNVVSLPPRSVSASPKSIISPLGTPSPGISSNNGPKFSVPAAPSNYSVAPLNIRRISGQTEPVQSNTASFEKVDSEGSSQDEHKLSVSQVSMVSESSQDLCLTMTGSSSISLLSSPSVTGSSASYVSPDYMTPGTPGTQESFFPPIKGKQPLHGPTVAGVRTGRHQSLSLVNELSRQRNPSSPKIIQSETPSTTSPSLSMSLGHTMSIRPQSRSPVPQRSFNHPRSMLLLDNVQPYQENKAHSKVENGLSEYPTRRLQSESQGHSKSQSLHIPAKTGAFKETRPVATNESLFDKPATPKTKPANATIPHVKSLLGPKTTATAKPRPVSLPLLARTTTPTNMAPESSEKSDKEKSKWRLSSFFKGSKKKKPVPERSFNVISKPQTNYATAVNFAPDYFPFDTRPALERSMTPLMHTPSPHPDVDPIDHQDGLRSNSPFVEPLSHVVSSSEVGVPVEAPVSVFLPPPKAVEMPAEVHFDDEPIEMSASPIRADMYVPQLTVDGNVRSSISRNGSGNSHGRLSSSLLVEPSDISADKDSGVSDQASMSTVDIAEAQAKPVMRPQLVQVSSSTVSYPGGRFLPKPLPKSEPTAQPHTADCIPDTEATPAPAAAIITTATEMLPVRDGVQAELQTELMELLNDRDKVRGIGEKSSPASLDDNDTRPITPAGQMLSQSNTHEMDCIVAPLITPRRSPAAKSPAPVAEPAMTQGDDTKTDCVTQMMATVESDDEGKTPDNCKWVKMPKVDYSGEGWDDDDY